MTMQLLELMHLLFSHAMKIQTAWERDPEQLWDTAWCPVLQVGLLLVITVQIYLFVRVWRDFAVTVDNKSGLSP